MTDSGHAPPHGGEDWRKRLRHATFRGAHFWVDRDSIDGGRRIVTHEFPLAELPYNEDMGQQARRYDMEAYVVGGQADKEAQKLIQACTAPGPATLVMPLFGTIKARCVGIGSNREKDKHGYVSFRLRFIADDLSLSALSGTPHLKTRIRNKVNNDLPPALVRQTNSRFATLEQADYVRMAAAALGRDWLAEVDEVIRASGLRGEVAAELALIVVDTYVRMDELIEIGQETPVISNTSFVAADATQTSDALVTATFNVLSTYVEAATPAVAMPALLHLADYGDDLDPVPVTTENRQREADNQAALVDLFRTSALAHYALAVVEASYPSRREAIQARAEVAERFTLELNKISRAEEWEVAEAVRDLMGLTVNFLSQLMTDLAPVLAVTSGASLPSLYWSYRLYADALRADELWQRNNVKHPAFMPADFEALAR